MRERHRPVLALSLPFFGGGCIANEAEPTKIIAALYSDALSQLSSRIFFCHVDLILPSTKPSG